ncbi:calcium-binding protein [Phaeobacter italicus]|uniref:hypothetical protein n=1 Tax=Phaeobacter italicus TaxID=481446 RepID=UPI0021E5782C|nr:hypothetical protein [Phaeobacter italicus]
MTGIEKIVNTHYKDAVVEVRSDTDFRDVQLINIDKIIGSGGGETIWGSADSDVIDAKEGDDVLDGGTGDDVLTGGAGADTFYFAFNDGENTVTDFTDGVDLLQLETSATDIADLSITQVDTDAHIITDSTTIILSNFTATNLTNADFDFI